MLLEIDNMKVIIYSEDLLLLYNWRQKITLCGNEILEDIEELSFYQDGILILDYSCCYKNLLHIVRKSKIHNIKILLLDRNPSFEKGKNLLSTGIYGYGNAMMNSQYLNSAIETIYQGMIWLYPEFTTLLIQSLNQKNEPISNEITQLLTSREFEIASLIKDGLSNAEISEYFQISINTVKSHIKKIYEKLQVKNRLALFHLFTTPKCD